MTEVSDGQIQTAALDYHGLVAAICHDLKIAQRIDDRLPCDSQRKVGLVHQISFLCLRCKCFLRCDFDFMKIHVFNCS